MIGSSSPNNLLWEVRVFKFNIWKEEVRKVKIPKPTIEVKEKMLINIFLEELLLISCYQI